MVIFLNSSMNIRVSWLIIGHSGLHYITVKALSNYGNNGRGRCDGTFNVCATGGT